MLVEKSIQIIGGKKLTGTIEVSGAKNAVLKPVSYTHLTLPTILLV